MSDPTIQTFCCHHNDNQGGVVTIQIMDEFNTESYNTVCLVSSTIGILGAMYQIFQNGVWRLQSPSRGRKIIMWLAVADLLASLGVLVRSSFWLKYKNILPLPDDNISVLFCSITSAWTQYFYTATWFWTLFYAVDIWQSIQGKDTRPLLYHSLAWGIPAATTSIGLSILYIPNATCHNLTSLSNVLLRILPNYCATYVPIALVMVINPIIYILAGKKVELTVALPLAQFTSKERRVVDALRLKFFLINVVFYVCWLPNLINGILIWTMWSTMPVKAIISIWYIMALMNPMQALLNALVYRKWKVTDRYQPMFHNGHKELNFSDEQSPLLGSEPPRLLLAPMPSTTITNYATL
ncbi:G-protein coupled receptor 143-like isoform X1 [Pieris brassicae]|uniref:G-protein coupled receptors family 1 profile domain-containing protein n=2 Tax=Pieris brassicae TaxID=7116 RepID=A0A9P0XCE0_PIEBR|nr:G-protein coupled receptor 143-like isoform X1 [Pieris brassicae]CAH4029649.1 unnamed protein product [Pieris brassicae]